jgi:hypothetical protein
VNSDGSWVDGYDGFYDWKGDPWYCGTVPTKFAIEILLVCYPGLFYIKIRSKFQDAVDPELRRKYRQLIRPFLMYLVQLFYLVALLVILAITLGDDWIIMMRFMNMHYEPFITFVLFLYLLLTIFPRNAITGFCKD